MWRSAAFAESQSGRLASMYIPKFLVTAGTAGVLIVGIAVVLLLFNKGDSGQTRTLDSYYFEARFEVEEREGARPMGPPPESRPALVRASYEAPDKWRREYTFSDP